MPAAEIILDLRVLGDGAAPLSRLTPNHRLAGAELKIEAALRITTKELTVDNATMTIGTHRLSVSDRLVFGSGLADTRLSLEASGPTLRQLGYDFAPVDEPFRFLGKLVYVDDSWRVEDFSGTVGHDVMTLTGTLDWHGSEGRLYKGEGGFLFSDLAMLVIPQVLSPGEPISQFSQQCGVVALKVKAGVAEADVAVLQTKALGIISTGRVDLATEAIDFGFRTKQLSGLGLSVGPC